tara:strand:- start:846 stop:1382 length:537 start_codon:yes stop_codon:yes gene_type:complete
MQEQISWDQSLVKKFGTSNHFKLLNQLRNEIKKYPLNKNKTLKDNNDSSIYPKNRLNSLYNDDINSLSFINHNDNQNKQSNTIYKSNHISYIDNDMINTPINSVENKKINNHAQTPITTKSNVSFNNSKNFNIYNNMVNSDYNNTKKNNSQLEKSNPINDESPNSLTFKDRLNKIDMK